MTEQKQRYPSFCPEHFNSSRTIRKTVGTCTRPEKCETCIENHVDQSTDPEAKQ